MFKHGRMALVAIACAAAPFAAQAQDNFFVGAQAGHAQFNVHNVSNDNAGTQRLSFGYRWQAGPVTQVGVEVGGGRIGEVGDSYYNGYAYDGVSVKTRYLSVGVNARFQFGRDSRWFAVARGGVMSYRQDNRDSYSSGGFTMQQSSSSSDAGIYAGAGLGVDLTPNFNLSVMLEGYTFHDNPYVDGTYSAGMITAGAELRF